jgi:hypothetical protein
MQSPRIGNVACDRTTWDDLTFWFQVNADAFDQPIPGLGPLISRHGILPRTIQLGTLLDERAIDNRNASFEWRSANGRNPTGIMRENREGNMLDPSILQDRDDLGGDDKVTHFQLEATRSRG